MTVNEQQLCFVPYKVASLLAATIDYASYPSLQNSAQRLWPNETRFRTEMKCCGDTGELRKSQKTRRFSLPNLYVAVWQICLEARAGIEPACEDLQSSTSPLRHRASLADRSSGRVAASSQVT